MGTLSDFHEDIESVALRLVADYRESLMAEAIQLCGDRAAAEDLVFRTLEVLFRGERPSGPDHGAPMIAWLRGVMRRIHRDSCRGMARASVVYLDPETLELVADANAETGTPAGVDGATDPAAAVQARDDAEKVREAVDSLPPRMREIIVLRYFESVSIARMAAVLRISQDAVKCRLYYARKVLAQRLRARLGNRGVKALLIALALAALTAIGAAVVTAVGDARNTPPAPAGGTPLSEGGCDAQESSPLREGAVAEGDWGSTAADTQWQSAAAPSTPPFPHSSTPPLSPTAQGETMNIRNTSSAILAAATLMTGAAIPSMTSGDQTQVTTNGTEVTIYVPDGTTYEFTSPLDANVTKLIKTGGGRCNLKATNTSDGRTGLISAGILAIDDRSSGVAAGWTRIDVEDGATLDLFLGGSGISRVGWSCLRSVPIYIAGSGCGGMGAIANTGTITVDATCAYVTLTADAQIGGGSDRANYTLGTGGGTPTQTLLDMQGHTLTLAGRVGFFTSMVIKNLGSLVIAENKTLSLEPSNSIKLANTQWQGAANPTVTFRSGSSLTFNPGAAGVDNFPWGISVPAEAGAVTLKSTSPKALHIKRPIIADGTLHLSGTQADVLVDGAVSGNVFGTGAANVQTVAVTNRAAVTVGALDAMNGTLLFENVARLSVTNQGTVLVSGLAGSGEVMVGGTTAAAANVARLVLKGDTHFAQDMGADKTNFVMVGCAASQYGVLDLKDGATLTNCIYVGKYGAGVINVFDDNGLGTTLYAPQRHRQLLGDELNGYGCLRVFGGKVFLPGRYCSLLGRNFGTGIVAQHGGEMSSDGYLWLSRGGSASHWFMDGGTFTSSDIGGEGIRMCACDGNFAWRNGYAVLTVGGDPLGTARMQVGTIQCFTANYASGADDTLMAINLNTNGWLATPRISRTTTDIAEAWNRPVGFDINFNGGTLHTSRDDNGEFFIADKRKPRRVTVYAGGATIETEGDVTWRAPIQAPTGKGLAVTLDDAGAIAATDWIGPTRVYASGGSGTGFTGLTDVDPATGTLRGVIVTSPGRGYQDGDEVTVLAKKPNRTESYACTATLVDLPATGGLTKKGPGQLTLTYENTYGGATRVEEGTIRFADTSGMPEGGVLEVPAGVLAGIEAPLVDAKAFRASKIVVTDVTASLPRGLQTVVVSETAVTVPPVEFRDASGQPVAAPGGFICKAGPGGKSIRLGVSNGFFIIIQ